MARPLAPTGGNDRVYTPKYLVDQIVTHFGPSGTALDPCSGHGVFVDSLANIGCEVDWCELDLGRDFFTYDFKGKKFDYVVTNPPWSLIRPFMQRSMDLSDNVIFLCLVNAFFMKARMRDIKAEGFGFKEILFLDTPPKNTGWPQTGFALGAVHIQKGWDQPTKFSSLI
jgi:hypothetical protein